MSDFRYETVERLGTLSSDKYGHTLEVNVVSFNGGTPKLDIRKWSGEAMLKGISLTKDEAEKLADILTEAISQGKLP